ncbi:hypothetical protein PF008_g16688 [Phytophthora fragariae]|uniref:Uncharacterized protein n=1 Tax=Phytophthora fragariae TaxID=53985 RepID=A0A6G0RAE2_9STRA|nr:hypothetical protein PF008_g16688 [Phytophthora fragariae]
MCVPTKSSGDPPVESATNTSASTPPQQVTSQTLTPHSEVESTADEFLEFEGITVMDSAPTCRYRYRLTIPSGQLRIWLEDVDSKKQWLNLENYVDLTNVLPNAKATDYVNIFHKLMNTAGDLVDSSLVSFERHKGQMFQLQLTVKVNVMQQYCLETYKFEMEPISLERIDVLESRMRDLEKEVRDLRLHGDTTHISDINSLGETAVKNERTIQKLGGDVAGLGATLGNLNGVVTSQTSSIEKLTGDANKLRQDLNGNDAEIRGLSRKVQELKLAQETTVSLDLHATAKVAGPSGGWIHWEGYPKGFIRIDTSGMFYVAVTVNYMSAKHSAAISLMKGADCLESAACVVGDRYSSSVSLSRIIRVEANDTIAVHCPVDLVGKSHLALFRLGN